MKPDPIELVEKGNEYFENDMFLSAIACYEQVIDADPTYLDAYVKLGIALLEVDQLEEAILNFEAALRFAPSNDDAMFGLGKAHLFAEHYQEAISLLKKVIQVRCIRNSYLKLGKIYEEENIQARAARAYYNAVTVEFDSSVDYCNLAFESIQAGCFEEATENYEKALEVRKKEGWEIESIERDVRMCKALKEAVDDIQVVLEKSGACEWAGQRGWKIVIGYAISMAKINAVEDIILAYIQSIVEMIKKEVRSNDIH